MKSKFDFLDGLRGWAALIVFILHSHIFLWICPTDNFMAKRWFYGTPARLCEDGASAICLFFILSGFVLSYKFFMDPNNRYKYLVEAANWRYFRLVTPVFFSVLFSFILVKCDFMHNTHLNPGAYVNDSACNLDRAKA